MGHKGSKEKKNVKPEEPQTIVVFGATGNQGSSVVHAMKDDAKFKVKAVTRNPESEKAKALAELGVEIVQADLDNRESLENAVEGAWGVFVVTNYWESMDPEKEIQQGKNIADACIEKKVQFMVCSTLEDVKSQIGKECPHFDAKAKIQSYLVEKEMPFCAVMYSFYMENLLGLLKPRKSEDGDYILDIPMGDSPLDMISAKHTGECIHQIFIHHTEYKGKEVGLSSDKKTVTEYAEIFSKHIEGKNFKATEMTTEQLEESGQPFAQESATMFEFYIKGKFSRDLKLTKQLHPNIPDFEEWVKINKDALTNALE